MEKQMTIVLDSSRHIYVKKHEVEWKSNKERNFRNSHGKIKFLEKDKFSPFHVVTQWTNNKQIWTAKANMA